jgi:sugar lactone lactonase YvrE
VIPRHRGGFVAVGATEVLLVDERGASSPFAHLGIEDPSVKMNDAKCDSRGRIWTGTLTMDFRPGAAALYRIDPDGSVAHMLGDLTLANGLAWSPDERIFYLIDSLAQSVDAFDFDIERGHIANRRTLITVEGGAPNGMTVDRGGGLWIAVTGAGEVRRYDPDGTLRGRIEISIPGATSCAFGGAQGKDLFIGPNAGGCAKDWSHD